VRSALVLTVSELCLNGLPAVRTESRPYDQFQTSVLVQRMSKVRPFHVRCRSDDLPILQVTKVSKHLTAPFNPKTGACFAAVCGASNQNPSNGRDSYKKHDHAGR
jgi:hypothetical protein